MPLPEQLLFLGQLLVARAGVQVARVEYGLADEEAVRLVVLDCDVLDGHLALVVARQEIDAVLVKAGLAEFDGRGRIAVEGEDELAAELNYGLKLGPGTGLGGC